MWVHLIDDMAMDFFGFPSMLAEVKELPRNLKHMVLNDISLDMMKPLPWRRRWRGTAG